MSSHSERFPIPTIVIQGTVIDFPDSAASPDWSPAIIQFAQSVEAALNGLAGSFDVSPQTFVIDSFNPGTNIDIPNLNFPSNQVRATFIRYTVHRATDSNEVNEEGDLWAIYNDSNGIWDFSQQKSQDGSITFNITNTGQVQFTTSTIAGTSHTGFITFTAQSLQNP